MIKRFGSFVKCYMKIDDDTIDRVTTRDVVVLVLFCMIAPILLLPLLPLLILIDLFETAFAFLVVGSVFASPISLYLIVNGQWNLVTILVALLSTAVLVSRYLVYPIVNRSEHYKRFNERLNLV